MPRTLELLLWWLSGLTTNSNYFLLPFCEKSLVCLEGKPMTPHREDTFLYRSSQHIPRLCLGPMKVEGLFELKRRPSRALDSPRALLPELQKYKDTIRCAALGAEVPGHRQQQLPQTLIVRLLKTHFLTPILDCEMSTE